MAWTASIRRRIPLDSRLPRPASAPWRDLRRVVLFVPQRNLGGLGGRCASLATRRPLVVFVLGGFERETDPPGTDIAIGRELIRRRGPWLAIQFH